MTDAGRRAGFAQKTKPRRFVTEIFLADDFQCHRASQIDVERFVSDSHRTATQLDRFPIFADDQLIVLKSLRCLLRRRLDGILGSRRLARLNPASESQAEHAHRTEFIAPESSLPQFEQVCRGSAFMGLAAFQPRATPSCTEWC